MSKLELENITDFYKKIAKIQNLLDDLNHFWAREICNQIFKEIEIKIEPISEVENSFWIYRDEKVA